MSTTPRKTLSMRLIETAHGRPIEDLLRDLFVSKRYDDREIADYFGTSRQVIATWRDRFGITRDERAPIQILPKVLLESEPKEAA